MEYIGKIFLRATIFPYPCRVQMPDEMNDVEGIFENFDPVLHSYIRRVKDGPELLDVLRRWKEPKLLDDALLRFSHELDFDKLNRHVNRLVFKQRWGTTEELTPYEQNDSGENEESLLESQNILQTRPTLLTPPKIRVAPGDRSSGTKSDEFG